MLRVATALLTVGLPGALYSDCACAEVPVTGGRLPPAYGFGCKPHDADGEVLPECLPHHSFNRPRVCDSAWCYVDQSCELHHSLFTTRSRVDGNLQQNFSRSYASCQELDLGVITPAPLSGATLKVIAVVLVISTPSMGDSTHTAQPTGTWPSLGIESCLKVIHLNNSWGWSGNYLSPDGTSLLDSRTGIPGEGVQLQYLRALAALGNFSIDLMDPFLAFPDHVTSIAKQEQGKKDFDTRWRRVPLLPKPRLPNQHVTEPGAPWPCGWASPTFVWETSTSIATTSTRHTFSRLETASSRSTMPNCVVSYGCWLAFVASERCALW